MGILLIPGVNPWLFLRFVCPMVAALHVMPFTLAISGVCLLVAWLHHRAPRAS